jgi:hypothetical protein
VYDPDQGAVLYGEENDLLYVEYADRIRAICDPVSGSTRVAVLRPVPADRWLLSHPIVTLPLLEILKRRGLYGLHAAGLSREGRGLLLVGASGSGKTTLAITLTRVGYDFLGDDMLFLSTENKSLQVRAFPDEVDITEHTARLFSELRPMLGKHRQPGWPKWSFRAEAMYDVELVRVCKPAAVVFPRIAKAETSKLELMGGEEALLEMVPNVLLTEAHSCQAHLAALARLATETPCYRLWTGPDFESLPTLLGSIL